jgi:excisionase family DNA binding protein
MTTTEAAAILGITPHTLRQQIAKGKLKARKVGRDKITLTQQERATLRRAADILDRVRELRNSRVPTDWYAGDEDDSDLVFGWRICDELATKGEIDAERVSA